MGWKGKEIEREERTGRGLLAAQEDITARLLVVGGDNGLPRDSVP